MRQGYTKPNTTIGKPFSPLNLKEVDGKWVMDIADRVQNPLQFVTNFAALNVELLKDLKEAITVGNASEVDNLIQDIMRNCHCIETHGQRVAQTIMQLQSKRFLP